MALVRSLLSQGPFLLPCALLGDTFYEGSLLLALTLALALLPGAACCCMLSVPFSLQVLTMYVPTSIVPVFFVFFSSTAVAVAVVAAVAVAAAAAPLLLLLLVFPLLASVYLLPRSNKNTHTFCTQDVLRHIA